MMMTMIDDDGVFINIVKHFEIIVLGSFCVVYTVIF